MKSELTHLLQKLQADHPDFKALQLFRNGAAMVIGNQSSRLFADLDALEAYAWPPPSPLEGEGRGEGTVGCNDPLPPAAQALPPLKEDFQRTSGYLDVQTPPQLP